MSTKDESFLIGVIGEGVMPSLSPAMHEREADHLGLRYLYRPIDLHELGLPGAAVGDLLTAARQMGFNGVAVTHPCKQQVLQYLDQVSDDARQFGAVNTVLIQDGRYIGHNTDFSGFTAALAEGLPGARLEHVVQLGAGGAGSAVAFALLAAGVKRLDLMGRNPARFSELVSQLSELFPDAAVTARSMEDLCDVMPLADGLVNTTPVGMAAHPGVPLDISLVQPSHWVADIVYRPLETQLVQEARAKGCRVLDGGRMAVRQAADAFSLFTGRDADASRMREHFLELIAAENSVAS
ncbi:shikimate dehydrogenase [Paenarthrobacter sp. NPDC090520]|uniref:shikimate dehydrogenase n=1 Tax=Paenarthrobacter sp. NPDC090520 TaxID=3364382 RepID=UPI003825B359